MKITRFTSAEIVKRVREAKDTCLLIIPGVDDIVADALIERAQKTAGKASVIIDCSHYTERSGYGKTAAATKLVECANETEKMEVNKVSGTRLGMLVTEHGAWIFAPSAAKVDLRKDGKEGFSAVALDANRDAAMALFNRILKPENTPPQTNANEHPTGSTDNLPNPAPDEAEPKAEPISPEEMNDEIKAIKEHPPRNYAEEKGIIVYTAYVGYIEMRLVGASLGEGTRLTIPSELVERGLGETELRAHINESFKINLDDEVDTGVREINSRVDAIRTLYTRQLGPPHGRIYRKRHREEIDAHLHDLDGEVKQANEKLEQKIQSAVEKKLNDLAKTYSGQTVQNARSLPKDEILCLLHQAWNKSRKTRPRKVKLEVTFKDLTWESLRNPDLRATIVDQFPELRNSKLYKEQTAHASDGSG